MHCLDSDLDLNSEFGCNFVIVLILGPLPCVVPGLLLDAVPELHLGVLLGLLLGVLLGSLLGFFGLGCDFV